MKLNRTKMTQGVFALALVAVLAAFGLATVAGSDPDENFEPPAAPEPWDLTSSDVAVVEDEIARLTPEGEPAPVIGETTKAAYQSAAEAFRSCVSTTVASTPEAALATVTTDSSTLSDDEFSINIVFSVDPVAEDGMSGEESLVVQGAVDSAEQGCFTEHLEAVELAYQAGLLADDDYMQSSRSALLDCANGLGVGPYSDPADLLVGVESLVPDKQDQVLACVNRFPSVSTMLAPLAGS